MNEQRSAENDALRAPEEWCALLGASILDHDGWRDGTRGWDEAITREEFDRRLIRCTIDARRYPSFIGRVIPATVQHDCATCADCIHNGNKCCGCYDGVCCVIPPGQDVAR